MQILTIGRERNVAKTLVNYREECKSSSRDRYLVYIIIKMSVCSCKSLIVK